MLHTQNQEIFIKKDSDINSISHNGLCMDCRVLNCPCVFKSLNFAYILLY